MVIEVLLVIILCVVLFLLVGAILLQKSEGGALAGLGSSDVSQYLGVRSAANFLSRATMILGIIFVLDVLTLAIIIDKSVTSNAFLNRIQQSSKAIQKNNNSPKLQQPSKPQTPQSSKK